MRHPDQTLPHVREKTEAMNELALAETTQPRKSGTPTSDDSHRRN